MKGPLGAFKPVGMTHDLSVHMRTSARAPAHLSACLRGAERPHDLPPHPQQRPQPSICPSAVLPSDKEEALGEGPATSVAPTPVRYQREQNQHLQLPALPPHPLTSSVSRPSPLALPREERKERDGGGAAGSHPSTWGSSGARPWHNSSPSHRWAVAWSWLSGVRPEKASPGEETA